MTSQLGSSQKDAVCRKVYSRYPLLNGVKPRVKCQKSGPDARYVLRFEKTISTSDGARLPTSVRVVTDDKGKVLKMTATR
ncbi:MAG: hypothetical protein ABFQ89_03125 [Chloroflexota bacterium]